MIKRIIKSNTNLNLEERCYEKGISCDLLCGRQWNDWFLCQSVEYSSWMVDEAHMAVTNNARFMHCLPVRRNVIVSDGVIDSERSIVIPEAANRVTSIQVVMKRMLEDING